MSKGKWKKDTLIPFQVINYRVPRLYILKCYKAEELTLTERSKLSKIKHNAERIINKANHVISIIDSTTRRAVQKEVC